MTTIIGWLDVGVRLHVLDERVGCVMPTGFFITGTDTGVGKTYTTVALARCARNKGRRVFAFKPIETGCQRIGGQLVGEDQTKLVTAAGSWQQGSLAGLYRFEQPVAPLVAAELARTAIDLPTIVELTRDGAAQAEVTLVEGAGGWRVPITNRAWMSDLAIALELPVIVVARATLGTINHTQLTVEAVERDGCSLAAVVMSKLPTDDAKLAQSNVVELRRRIASPIIVLEQDESVLNALLL